jgi:hypothetical protein
MIMKTPATMSEAKIRWIYTKQVLTDQCRALAKEKTQWFKSNGYPIVALGNSESCYIEFSKDHNGVIRASTI